MTNLWRPTQVPASRILFLCALNLRLSINFQPDCFSYARIVRVFFSSYTFFRFLINLKLFSLKFTQFHLFYKKNNNAFIIVLIIYLSVNWNRKNPVLFRIAHNAESGCELCGADASRWLSRGVARRAAAVGAAVRENRVPTTDSRIPCRRCVLAH